MSKELTDKQIINRETQFVRQAQLDEIIDRREARIAEKNKLETMEEVEKDYQKWREQNEDSEKNWLEERNKSQMSFGDEYRQARLKAKKEEEARQEEIRKKAEAEKAEETSITKPKPGVPEADLFGIDFDAWAASFVPDSAPVPAAMVAQAEKDARTARELEAREKAKEVAKQAQEEAEARAARELEARERAEAAARKETQEKEDAEYARNDQAQYDMAKSILTVRKMKSLADIAFIKDFSSLSMFELCYFLSAATVSDKNIKKFVAQEALNTIQAKEDQILIDSILAFKQEVEAEEARITQEEADARTARELEAREKEKAEVQTEAVGVIDLATSRDVAREVLILERMKINAKALGDDLSALPMKELILYREQAKPYVNKRAIDALLEKGIDPKIAQEAQELAQKIENYGSTDTQTYVASEYVPSSEELLKQERVKELDRFVDFFKKQSDQILFTAQNIEGYKQLAQELMQNGGLDVFIEKEGVHITGEVDIV